MQHLRDTQTLGYDDALRILDVAEDMSDTQRREVRKLPTLRGKTIVNLFFEDSTRTRISFEAAAKRLSADVINFSAKGSSVSKGESLQNTAPTLQAMGADAVVIRHGASGAPRTLATSGWITAGVVNAGAGKSGRASCRERVGQYGSTSVVSASLQKKHIKQQRRKKRVS